MRQIACSLCVVLVVAIPAVAQQKATPVKVEPSWKGSVENEALMLQAVPVVTNQKAFAKLMESWKVAEKVPEVDFKKNIVLVITSKGGSLNLRAQRKDGNLLANGVGTLDLKPGFRYVIGVVSREGVTTVNGKELPKE